jgi:hypothetical protein
MLKYGNVFHNGLTNMIKKNTVFPLFFLLSLVPFLCTVCKVNAQKRAEVRPVLLPVAGYQPLNRWTFFKFSPEDFH